MDVGNLISGSSVFSKTILNIWKFTIHLLLKSGLDSFEHYFTSVWHECNCAVVCTFFVIAFLWGWNENWPGLWWLLVQCSLPGSHVIKQLMQTLTMVPGQGMGMSEVVSTFFGSDILWDWNQNRVFQSCGYSWAFQICWHTECSTFKASSFRTWNSWTGILTPPLALLLVMLPKVYFTLDSRMSISRWVITPSWLSG